MSTSIENILVTELDILTRFWASTEGRDKFSKALQYGSRTLAHAYAGDKEISTRFANLQKVSGDARKIFRLGKSANEYIKIRELLKTNSADQVSKLANVFCRAAFFGYWVFDNLFILSKIGFIKGDQKAFNKKGAKFWFIGLVLGIFLEIYKLRKLQAREEKLTAADAAESKKISAEKVTVYQNIVKNAGDLITASHNAELVQAVFGRSFNEWALGLGGFTSAVITIYQTYPGRPAITAAPAAKKE